MSPKHRESTPTPAGSRWPVLPLSELAADEPNAITDGPFGSKLKTEHYTEDGPRVIRLQNIGDGTFVDAHAHISEEHYSNLQKHRVFEGDVVIAALGESPPRSCIVPDWLGPAIVKADCIRFKAGPKVLPKFINYALNGPALRRHAKGIIHGVGRPRLNLGEIKALPVPVPPISEQTAIVADIEKQFTRLDAGVAALRRVQANIKRYRAAVLKAACEGRLVPTEAELARKEGRTFETGEELLARIRNEHRDHWQGRGKYKEPSVPGAANLFELPAGWAWTTLDALAEIKGGITKDQGRKHSAPTRSVPYLRVANVQRGYIDLSEVKEIAATEDEIRELVLKPGDILFNEGGDRDKLGRGWIWNGELVECIHQNHVFRARLYVGELNPKLVSWYANTFGQKFFFDQGKHTTNLASISMSKLKGLPVPIPPPAEQKRIVAEVERRLSVVEEFEATVTANLKRATRLRQSVLHAAFRGAR